MANNRKARAVGFNHVALEVGVLPQVRRDEDATLPVDGALHGARDEHALDRLDLGLHLGHVRETPFDFDPSIVAEESHRGLIHQVRQDRRPFVLCLKLHSQHLWDRDASLCVHRVGESASCHRWVPNPSLWGGLPLIPT